MSIPPNFKTILSALAGGIVGIAVCVGPVWLGSDAGGREPPHWLALGWPGIWIACVAAAGLITIPVTFLALALAGPRHSAAAPLARRVRREAEKHYQQPKRDRELGMLAGALAGLAVCAAVPALLSALPRGPAETGFHGDALAGLLFTGALIAGVIAKLAWLEMQLRDPTY